MIKDPAAPAPIQAQYREMINTLANGIDDILNGKDCPAGEKKVAFCLIMANFGDIKGGRVNYISNGDRSDMVSLLTELLAKYTGAYDAPTSEARQ